MADNNVYSQKVDPHFSTKSIYAGQQADQWDSLAVVTPIVTATTFKQETLGGSAKYQYGRSGNPTRESLETCIAALENAKYGFCFASGLAALDTVVHLVGAGDHVICGDDVYGGTSRYLRHVIPRMGVEVSFIDTSNAENVRSAIKKNTKLVWVESPANPLMKLTDIAAVGKILQSRKDIILGVDNTFMSPYYQRPLALGADIVIHSLTKYINGHCDVIMGAIVTDRDDLNEKLKFLQNSIGAVPAPTDCYLVLRGIKTLEIRMKQHMANGLAVGKYLESHPNVERVLHPGLPSHPQHKIARQQTAGSSGMLSFYLKGGLKESQRFLEHLKVFTLAESLGGYKSLAELPSVMTHASIPREHREMVGITDSLIRLSVGIENVEDIIEDLDSALKAAAAI